MVRFFFPIALVMCASVELGCPPKDGPAYFVVGEFEPSTGDSYLLRLDDPGAIAHARSLITDPGGTESPLVVCAIAPGAGELPNRDVLNGGALWSWHVTEFIEFADLTAEILDGNPTMVEADVDGWIANTGGLIGFWSYTIIDEVTEDELAAFP